MLELPIPVFHPAKVGAHLLQVRDAVSISAEPEPVLDAAAGAIEGLLVGGRMVGIISHIEE